MPWLVIPFTATKIKAYRDWNSQIRDFSPTIGGKKIPTGKIPLFAHRVRMTSESDTNAKGTFFVPVGYRDNVKGMIRSPVQFFWNMEV